MFTDNSWVVTLTDVELQFFVKPKRPPFFGENALQNGLVKAATTKKKGGSNVTEILSKHLKGVEEHAFMAAVGLCSVWLSEMDKQYSR